MRSQSAWAVFVCYAWRTSNVQQAIPFFWVTDINACLRFHVDGLGFRLTKKWVVEDQIRCAGCSLTVPRSCCRDCDGVESGRRRLELLSVQGRTPDLSRGSLAGLSPSKTLFVGNNLWVVPYVDPDGYKIDFKRPTDVAEDTILGDGR